LVKVEVVVQVLLVLMDVSTQETEVVVLME
jgi:hypothetical protein